MKQVWTALFLVCVLGSVAFAQDGGPVTIVHPVVDAAAPGVEITQTKEMSGVAQILNSVIEVITAALGLLLIWLTKSGISFLEKKTKIDVPQKMEDMMFGWAEMGVHYATEKAHQYLNEHGEKMKGPEKLDAALKFAMALAEEHKLSTVAREKLTRYIEARLGMNRDA